MTIVGRHVLRLVALVFYNEPLNADSIDDQSSSHLGCDPLNLRGVAHSEGGCNSTSLNVGNNFVFKTPRHHRYATLMHEQWHVNIHRVREAVIAPY